MTTMTDGTIHVVGGDEQSLLVGEFVCSIDDHAGFRAMAQCVIDTAITNGYLSDNPITEEEIEEERQDAERYLTDNGFYVDDQNGGIDIYRGVELDDTDTDAVARAAGLLGSDFELSVFADLPATVGDFATRAGAIRIIVVDDGSGDNLLIAQTLSRCDEIPGGVSFTDTILLADSYPKSKVR